MDLVEEAHEVLAFVAPKWRDCSWCGAKPGRPCRVADNHSFVLDDFHYAREEAV